MSTENANTSNTTNNSQEPASQGPSKKPGLNTNQKILIGGFSALLVVVVAAAVIIISILNKPEPAPLPTGGNLVINEDNLSAIQKEIKANVAEGMFMTDMNIDWVFPDGKSPSTNAYIGNAANNRRPIFFDLIRTDTNEVIYTSDVIPVGYSLKELKLDTDLTAGTYSMTCNIHLLDEETGSTVSDLAVGVTVRIQN